MRISTIIGLFIFALCQSAMAKTYLWYDDNGQAVFSEIPPEDGRGAQTVKPPPPPAESPAEARKRLDQRLQKFMDNREDEELAQEKRAKSTAITQKKQTSCDTARRNLTKLQQNPRGLAKDSAGNYHRYSTEQRAEKAAHYQKIIKRDCQ